MRKYLRGIIPAGTEPGMPNGGGGMPPIKYGGLVSIGVSRASRGGNAHQLGN